MDLKDKSRHIPWVVYEAKVWLDNFLKEDMIVFEWGSGGSTLYFCKQVKKIISVEHNKEWFNQVSIALDEEKIKNCDYYLIKPKRNIILKYFSYCSILYNSKTFLEYKDFSFKNYVKKIDEYEDGSLDFVFIDGRARIACIAHAIKKIKKGGFLMLDNSERKDYSSAIVKLKKFKRIDFFGHGPYLEDLWQTTVWEIS